LFYNKGIIKNAADLYQLKKEDIATLDRFGERSAQNLIESLENSKQVPFTRVLYALGIRHVGETVAKILANHFGSIYALKQAGFDKLVSINEIGDIIAKSIIEYFSNDDNNQQINQLQKAGIQLEISKSSTNKSEKLLGKTIVISGTFEKHSRDELKELIEKHGGKNAGSVSSKTTYLLAGEGIGPKKLETANNLGIPIINEDDFLGMIG
jgi:DNA ligase (NAD+)